MGQGLKSDSSSPSFNNGSTVSLEHHQREHDVNPTDESWAASKAEDLEKVAASAPAMNTLESTAIEAKHHNPYLWFFVNHTHVPDVPHEKRSSPQENANILSRLTWNWMTPLLATGFVRTIVNNDLWLVPHRYSSERRMTDYEKKLNQLYENAAAKGKQPKYPEFRSVIYSLRRELLFQFLSMGTLLSLEILMPLLNRAFITFIDKAYSHEHVNQGRGVGMAIGTSILQFIFCYCFITFSYSSKVASEGIRCVLLTAVYRKALRLSPEGRAKFSVSTITSMSTLDVNRIMMATRWAMIIPLFPVMVGACIGILVYNLGVSGLVGVAVIATGIFINFFTAKKLISFRGRSIPFQDKRISLIRESVQNMRIVKYYGWESSFLNIITKVRGKERYWLKVLGYTEAGVEALVVSFPQFGAVAALGVRQALRKNFSPALVFPSLSLFTTFIPLTMFFTLAISSSADAWRSVGRLEKFFRAPENVDYIIRDTDLGDLAIDIDNASFKWAEVDPVEIEDMPGPSGGRHSKKKKGDKSTKDSKRTPEEERQDDGRSLYDIADETPAVSGGLITANAMEDLKSVYSANIATSDALEEISRVQSETSQLARAGASEFPGLNNLNIKISKGEFVVIVGSIGSGKTSLLSAIAGNMNKISGSISVDGIVSNCLNNWSKNDTIRENILFGKPFDSTLYSKTVESCCLTDDFALFKNGDLTEVGERGVTLSGGQKARVSLARTVYYNGDILLLDDVLSAVDSRVGKKILNECLLGALKGKTILLATHHLHIINHADKVIFLDGRGNATMDTNSNLRATIPEYDQLIQKFGSEATEEEEVTKIEKAPLDEDTEVSEEKIEDNLNPAADKLMTLETKSSGTIKRAVLADYYRSGRGGLGHALIPCIVFSAVLLEGAQLFSTVWINYLTESKWPNLSISAYLGIYAVLLFLTLMFRFTTNAFLCSFCFNSSTNMHNLAVKRLFSAPISFFDSTPLGRILTRFTEDIANMDTNTYKQLTMGVFTLSSLVGTLITVFIYVPYAAALLAPIFVMFLFCFSYYRSSARELKRFDALFRSAMMGHTTETYNGLQTIIAYNQADAYRKILDQRIDNMNGAFLLTACNQSWLTARLNIACVSITFLVTIVSSFRLFSINASSAGLLLSILPGISQSLVFLTPNLADLENELNSVERLWEYTTTLPQEKPRFITETEPPKEWPQRGEVEFRNVVLRYRPNAPAVLNGVSFVARPGEKVGICGRTGAGKSTTLNALFRLNELESGSILIDGIDVSALGLETLRSKISIIPQEPVLFEGTIRSNLDPFNERTDLELWDALRRSNLITKSELNKVQAGGNHKFHLDKATDDEGTNYSLGERQLLTLARALVRRSKILVLDEATATVDYATDHMIQQTIATEFSDCTILCIAHRLKTILQYDKIMVMGHGEVLEFDTPMNLYNKTGSEFRLMCEQSDITASDFQGTYVVNQATDDR